MKFISSIHPALPTSFARDYLYLEKANSGYPFHENPGDMANIC